MFSQHCVLSLMRGVRLSVSPVALRGIAQFWKSPERRKDRERMYPRGA